MLLKPFYQGKLDAFCAIYAVLNALRLIKGIRVSKARDILNETLLSLCLQPKRFSEVLYQHTDYIDLVDEILEKQKKSMSIEVIKPFNDYDKYQLSVFWDLCEKWLEKNDNSIKESAIVLRFFRYLTPEKEPINRHWTTVDSIDQEKLHLFDCSHEAEAILNIKKSTLTVDKNAIDKDHLIFIQPESVRFIKINY